MPCVTPARCSSSGVWPHCEVRTGRLHRLSIPPRLAARRMTCRRSKKRDARSKLPPRSTQTIPPKPCICLRGQRVIGMRLEARVVDRARRRESRASQRATAIAFALWRWTRTCSVFSAAAERVRGVRIEDRRRSAGGPSRSAPSAPPGPASAPAVTSLWPFRYFVALCMTRSTPSAIGCWLTGLANVLSMTEIRRARGRPRRSRRCRRSAASG